MDVNAPEESTNMVEHNKVSGAKKNPKEPNDPEEPNKATAGIDKASKQPMKCDHAEGKVPLEMKGVSDEMDVKAPNDEWEAVNAEGEMSLEREGGRPQKRAAEQRVRDRGDALSRP